MIPELIRGVLAEPPPSSLFAIGFRPEEEAAVRELAPGGVVDLDAAEEPADHGGSGTVAVLARTFTDLRRAASLAALLPKAARHVVAVAVSSADRPFLPASVPGSLSFQARRGKAGEWVVEIAFAGPRPVGESVAALVRGQGGHRLRPVPGPRVALAGPGASHWRPGDPGATPTTPRGPLGNPDGPPPADVVLRTSPDPGEWSDPRVEIVIDRPSSGGGTLYEMDAVPPVDERSVNPTGFVTDPKLGDAVLTLVGDRWCVRAGSDDLVLFPESGAVTDADVDRLRQVRAVTVDWGTGARPLATARVVAGLAAAGVPLRAEQVPPWAMALGGDLTAALIATADMADDLRREEHSVRLRRAALRGHSTEARWRSLALAAGLPVPPRPTASVVLCTRRPEFLGFALGQIAAQRDVDLEVVLTLHGIPADLPEVKAAVTAFDRPFTVVEVPADVPFGVALNLGVARASGRYVAKWDDDDWYGPDFLADMLLASGYSGAELVGCHAQFVYLGQIDLTIYRKARSELMGRWISGGTFVMERPVLDAVGGFPPVPRHVDAALVDLLTAAGGRTYGAHSLGYALHRRAAGHTWNQPVTYFLRAAARQWRGRRFSSFITPERFPLPAIGDVR
ncbi:glycosyltransferase [Actinomadura decatromicini]|nr:glycosyltransferase [Actinomadura decatromicini]